MIQSVLHCTSADKLSAIGDSDDPCRYRDCHGGLVLKGTVVVEVNGWSQHYRSSISHCMGCYRDYVGVLEPGWRLRLIAEQMSRAVGVND